MLSTSTEVNFNGSSLMSIEGIRQRTAACIAVLAIGLSGCGGSGDRPELGLVKGTVTIDGDPLGGAIIIFQPEKGRASTAIIGPRGDYELVYRQGVSGAKIGPHTIRFEWPIGSGGAVIPEKYTTKSELKETVQEGENTFDFELKGEGDSKATPKPQVD
jgi:hypothetical protein